MTKKSTTQMTKTELQSLIKTQAETIHQLESKVTELEQQLQIRAAAVMLDQDSSHLVSVLKERIKTLEQERSQT